MILYKLTNEYDKTFNGTQWDINVTHTSPGKGKMCSSGFIHAYVSPHHAILFNPIHGDFNPINMHIWVCEGDVVKNDGLKVGCTELTTIKRVEIPEISIRQKIFFGYLCVEDILYIFKRKYPDDKRLKVGLNIIKKYLNDKTDNKSKVFKKFYFDKSIQDIIYIFNCISNAVYFRIINFNIDSNIIDNRVIFNIDSNIIDNRVIAETAFFVIKAVIYNNTLNDAITLIHRNIEKMIKFK